MKAPRAAKLGLVLATLALGAGVIGAQMTSQSSGPAATVAPVGAQLTRQQIIASIASAQRRIHKRPRDAAAWFALGKALQLGGGATEAAHAYDQALALDPKLPDAWSGKGALAAQDEKWWLAAKDYGRAVALAPQDVSAHFSLGEMLLRVGDFEKAGSEFTIVLHRNPQLCCFCAGPNQKAECGPAALFADVGLGHVLMQRGDLAGAERLFQRALEFNPDFPSALISEGQILLRKSKPAEAAADFEAALRVRPKSLPATNGLATAYRQLGKSDRASIEFSKARALFNRQQARLRAEDENNRGLGLWHQGNLSAAAQTFRSAIDYASDYAPAHNNLGIVLYLMGDASGAIKQFSTAVALQPDYTKAHNNWGLVLMDQGSIRAAIDQFEAAISAQPGDADAHLNLGIALERNGKDKKAESQLRLAIQLAPAMAKPHVELGLLLVSRKGGLTREARQQIEQGLRLDPGLKRLLPEKILARLPETGPRG